MNGQMALGWAARESAQSQAHHDSCIYVNPFPWVTGLIPLLVRLDPFPCTQQMLICLSGETRELPSEEEEEGRRGGSQTPQPGRGCFVQAGAGALHMVKVPFVKKKKNMHDSTTQTGAQGCLDLKRKFSITCLISSAGFWGSRVAFSQHQSWQTQLSGNTR